jgi:NADH:ubiquinone oxidoreductase subunit 6 (subunit J)
VDPTKVINIILLVALVLAALITVTSARVLRAALALAVTSAILTILMFRMGAPIAGVFELSVCAGLIPAIFISVVGLTERLGPEGVALRRKRKLQAYGALPLIVIAAAVALWFVHVPLPIAPPDPAAATDVRIVLWNLRHVDLLGQIAVLAAGAFGVVILVRGTKRD